MKTNTLGNVVAGDGVRVVLAASRFNDVVVGPLLEAALATCRAQGVADSDVWVVRCPGAWELPGVVARVLDVGQVDAVVALGAVVRGDTPHFDYVCAETARGLMKLSLGPVPIGFGVLTTDTMEQALARAGGSEGNKGIDATLAALEMVQTYRQLTSAGLGRRR